MRAIHVLPGAVLALALLGAGASAASAADESSATCSVTVDRAGAADSLSITQQKLDGGACVCYVTTGPTSQSEATEKRVAVVQSSGKCSAEYKDWGTYLLSIGAGVGGLVALTQDGGNDSTGG